MATGVFPLFQWIRRPAIASAFAGLLGLTTSFSCPVFATSFSGPAMAQQAPAQAEKPENFDHAICRLIDDAAASNGLPNAFLTRLIWRESSFRPHVVSHAGAQGIAQFMPATAKARGLENPFDPATAIPASAALLADHMRQFGNLGLAAAAYNAGPGRVSGFLAGGGLPMETRNYVRFITGRSAEQWAELKQGARISLATDEESGVKPSLPKDSSPTKTPEEAPETPEEADPSGVTLFPPEPCLTTLASLRKGMPAPEGEVNPLFAPWGVQISGNFNRATALASFRRTAARHRNVMGELTPVIVATRMGGRGRRVFYRVRLPAETRREANALCNRLRKAGGACIVLPN